MTKSLILAGFGTALLLAGGCAAVRSPVSGSLYLDVKSSESVGTGTVAPKSGTSKATTILGWVGTGDASINAAAKAGGISRIGYVDYQSTNILGIFGTTETIVYGE